MTAFRFMGPFILKLTFGDNNKVFLRYSEYEDGIEFMNIVSDFFGIEVIQAYMTEKEFINQAYERNHPEWIDQIQDTEETANY